MKRIIALLPMQFIKFGIVGTGGYIVDVAVLKSLTRAGLDPYNGQIVAFIAASGFTWLANRLWTFRERTRKRPMAQEWLRYAAVVVGGFCVNYAVYALLLTLGGIWADHTELPVALGSIAGLAFNFPASRYFVFKPPSSISDRPIVPASSQDP